MSESDTPRTDAARLYNLREVAEELERELTAARAELAENESVINVWRGRTQRAEAELETYRDSCAAKADRIAQAVFVCVPPIEWEEVAELGATVRGEGGFGSTGR